MGPRVRWVEKRNLVVSPTPMDMKRKRKSLTWY